ncbi:MAG: AAA family ATPase, partial [Deltaproteobacteria bacterium]|nr:AAA family ATPase [Deltaproteobacteria bacterium]
MALKELPLGDSSFGEIIDRNLLYADKTRYIYGLVKSSKKNYFLSRPRRFGKTLLLSTIKELFSGNRERFRGLWIDKSDYAFPAHPVLDLSLSLEAFSPETLRANILNKLKNVAEKANLAVDGLTPGMCLGNLIQDLYKK